MAIPSPAELLGKVQGGSTQPLYSSIFNKPASGGSAIPSPQDILSKVQQENPAPSFTSNLITAGKSVVSKISSAVGGFAKTNAQNFSDAATGRLGATPSDYLSGLEQTFSGLGSGVVSLARGFNEGVVRIGKSAATSVLGDTNTRAIGDLAGGALRSFGQDLTGTESTPTYQEIFSKAHDYALNNNASTDTAKSFGGLVVIGSLFMDNPIVGPEGAGAKGLFKLSEQGVDAVAKTTDEQVIKDILKKENPGLTDTQLDAIAPAFREAQNPAEAKAAADQITKINETAASHVETKDLPAPEEVAQAAERNVAPPELGKPAEQSQLPYFRALGNGGETATKFVPVEGEPVKIVDGLETFLHQPENGAYEVLDARTGRMIGTPGATPEEAIQAAKYALKDKSLPEIQAQIAQHPPAPRTERIPSEARAPLGAPQPFDKGLIRDISQQDAPGPIVERMQEVFPNLSPQALTPIARRLSQLTRTGDIEGILHVVRNIDGEIAAARAGTRSGQGPINLTKDAFAASIAKAGERKAVGDLPPTIGELLTTSEKSRYLSNVERVVKNREDAVLAEQEYNALWEHADQRIIDRYEELKTQRDMLRYIMSEHPGKQLLGLYKGTFKSPEDVQLDELINQVKHVRGSQTHVGIDTAIDEIMGNAGGDIQDAQATLEAFRAMRKQEEEMTADIRELRPKVAATRVLQSMVEDVPMIGRENAGKIESLANPEDVRTYKDISGFFGQARDVYRNFEQVFGDRFEEVKKVILDPFDKSKGDMVHEIAKLGDAVEENVIKKYDIQRGSKESRAVQLWGEGKISEEELTAMVGSKAGDIKEAATWFRGQYDKLLDEVNAVRESIYPNDPSKIIPKRKDYFRHFEEISDGFRKLIEIFETPAGIDPQLAGLSEWTKPKSKFLSFAQQRLGKHTAEDAVGGFLNYAPTFAYAKHIDPHIGNFRYLRRRLAEQAPTPGTTELVPVKNEFAASHGAVEPSKQNGINNFLEFLDHYANDLAGKTNPMDRWLQTIVPGGRKTFRTIDWLNSRVKANKILGNLSSSVAQIFNVPQGIASAKQYSIGGINRTLGDYALSIARKDIQTPIASSAFIAERYKQPLDQRFKLDWVDHPIRGSSERARDMAAWLTGVLDEVGTKFIWNAHYDKALAEGISDPVKYADDMARRMVAGRGVGEVPLIQKSKVFQLVAPFQLEVGNLWYVMGDFLKKENKVDAFGSIAILFIANYLMNRAAEGVRGSPVVFDPIQALLQGSTDAAAEVENNNDYGRAAFKFTGRQVGEILSNLPVGQTVAAALPDDFVKNKLGFQGGKAEVFGNGDPGRFGNSGLIMNGLTDPLYSLLLPFGGTQAKKTIEGIQAMLEGHVDDKKGNRSFNTKPTLANVVQSVLFGKNATEDARHFYDTRDDLFQRINRQDATRTEKGVEAEKVWADTKKLLQAGKQDEALAKLSALDTTDPQLSAAVKAVATDEAAGLTGTDRLVKQLGVDNGERAKYISEQLSKLSTLEDQAAYLQDLDDKGLISATVSEQLQVLIPAVIKKK
jgi:hypothetical protein